MSAGCRAYTCRHDGCGSAGRSGEEGARGCGGSPRTRARHGREPRPGPLNRPEVDAIRAGYAFEAPCSRSGRSSTATRCPRCRCASRSPCSTATASSPARPAPARPAPCSCSPSSCRRPGVPVFAADIKGDLSGVATPGEASEKLLARTAGIGQEWRPRAFRPSTSRSAGSAWACRCGRRVAGSARCCCSKVLGLNATQESSLGLVFHYAEKRASPLRRPRGPAGRAHLAQSDEGKGELKDLGGLSAATVGVILRELITFADQGADVFFGEPEIDIAEFLRIAPDGRGIDQPARGARRAGQARAVLDVPDVAARRAVQRPARGGRPRQAQAGVLLRRGAPAVPGRVEGLPGRDHPDRAPHPLKGRRRRSSSPRPPKTCPTTCSPSSGRASSTSCAPTPRTTPRRSAPRCRPTRTPGYDLEEVLTQLGTGEAIVTVMSEKGAPTPVAWTRLRAPQGSMAPVAGSAGSRPPSQRRRCRPSTEPQPTQNPRARFWRKLAAAAAEAAKVPAPDTRDDARPHATRSRARPAAAGAFATTPSAEGIQSHRRLSRLAAGEIHRQLRRQGNLRHTAPPVNRHSG